MLEGSINNVPKSHRVVPRGREENLIVGTELEVSDKVVMSGQGVFWNGNGVEVVSSVVVEVPNEDLLVSSSGDKEGSRAFFNGDTARGYGGDLGLVSFDELFR